MKRKTKDELTHTSETKTLDLETKRVTVLYAWDDRVFPYPQPLSVLSLPIRPGKSLTLKLPVSMQDMVLLPDKRPFNTRPLSRYELMGYIHAHMAFDGNVPALTSASWLNLLHALVQSIANTKYKIQRPGEEPRVWEPTVEGDLPPILRALFSPIPGTSTVSRAFYAAIDQS